MSDEQYMRQALALAEQARGGTSPNPLVGALIVKNGAVVGRGWHQQAGMPHAEIHALADAGHQAQGACMYVTLEPCSHHGRTGPCTEAIIRAGVHRVVAAMTDPNPAVAGQGFRQLRENGVEVVEGVLAHEAARQNDIFLTWITTGKPFIALKSAMTLDGKIATGKGDSRWITCAASRQFVHQLRSQYDAVLVGIGTVLADNPQLTNRTPDGGKNPIRLVLDSQARTPLDSHVIADGQAPTIIVVAEDAPSDRVEALRLAGVDILVMPRKKDRIDLPLLLAELGRRPITSILVESGGAVNGSLIDDGLADKVYWFIAPKLTGGSCAPGPVGGQGVAKMDEAHQLEEMVWQPIGSDMLLTAYFTERKGRHVYRTCGRIG